MKDIVKIHRDETNISFEVVGRIGSGMNLAAEKVSEIDLSKTISQLRERKIMNISHYFVAPSERNGRPCYEWTLFTNDNTVSAVEKTANTIDQTLMQISGDYEDCRVEGVLALPKVRIAPAHNLESYFNKYKDKGQFKMKTTFARSDDFIKFWGTVFPNTELTVAQ